MVIMDKLYSFAETFKANINHIFCFKTFVIFMV